MNQLINPKKLRPFILTCDMRLDMFRRFVKSYKTVAHTMFPPIVLAGFYDPDKKEEYSTLIQELNPHVVIEQPNYIKDGGIDIDISKSGGAFRAVDPRYLNLQKIVIKDFPEIALKYSDENIVWIEDDVVFSSQFPEAVKKVNKCLQLDYDIITLYSPSLRYYTFDNKRHNGKKGDPFEWDLKRGITDNGYATKQSLASDNFAHAIDGNSFYGTPCVVFSRKILMKFRENWEEMETLSTAWDERWGIYAENNGFRLYATRKSYVQHQHGYSIIKDENVSISTKTFVE